MNRDDGCSWSSLFGTGSGLARRSMGREDG
jgi:hypothetical protein